MQKYPPYQTFLQDPEDSNFIFCLDGVQSISRTTSEGVHRVLLSFKPGYGIADYTWEYDNELQAIRVFEWIKSYLRIGSFEETHYSIMEYGTSEE